MQNGSAKVTIGDIVCKDSEHLEIRVDGSLRLLEDKREKVFWHNWGKHFSIEFDFVLLKDRSTYLKNYTQESWTILEVISEDPIPNQVFTKIIYVPSQANLTFIQATDNEGVKSMSYMLRNDRLNKMIQFKANAIKIKKNSPSGEFYTFYKGNNYKWRWTNHLVSRQTRFSVSKVDCEYFEVSNLIIRN